MDILRPTEVMKRKQLMVVWGEPEGQIKTIYLQATSGPCLWHLGSILTGSTFLGFLADLSTRKYWRLNLGPFASKANHPLLSCGFSPEYSNMILHPSRTCIWCDNIRRKRCKVLTQINLPCSKLGLKAILHQVQAICSTHYDGEMHFPHGYTTAKGLL